MFLSGEAWFDRLRFLRYSIYFSRHIIIIVIAFKHHFSVAIH